MICDHCLEDCSTHNYKGNEVCSYCWDKAIPKIDARIERNERLGHTGDDMCGCSMCAAREEYA